jgi:riboflavin transporter FmnP
LIGLIVALLGLQVVDGVSTVFVLQHHIREENNYLMVQFASHWWFVPVIKVIPTLLVCLLILWVSKRYTHLRKPLVVGLAIAVIFMAVAVVSNWMFP